MGFLFRPIYLRQMINRMLGLLLSRHDLIWTRGEKIGVWSHWLDCELISCQRYEHAKLPFGVSKNCS